MSDVITEHDVWPTSNLKEYDGSQLVAEAVEDFLHGGEDGQDGSYLVCLGNGLMFSCTSMNKNFDFLTLYNAKDSAGQKRKKVEVRFSDVAAVIY